MSDWEWVELARPCPICAVEENRPHLHTREVETGKLGIITKAFDDEESLTEFLARRGGWRDE